MQVVHPEGPTITYIMRWPPGVVQRGWRAACSASGSGRHCAAVLPVVFTLPGLGWEIEAYGLMMALALLLAWVMLGALGRQDRLPPGPLGTAFVLGVGVGLVSARVAWVLQQPGPVPSAELWTLRGDQMAPFAGLTAAALVSGLHVMRRKVPVIAFYDVVAPGLIAGAMVERLGALLSGIGFGGYAPDLPWAIRFPVGSPAYVEHQRVVAELLPLGAEHSLPVHPTQIYGVVVAGVTLVVALAVRRRRRFSGQVFLVACITYLLGRALVEDWFRADAGAAVLGPFNTGQMGALAIAAAMGIVLWSRARLAQHRPEAFRPWEGGRWTPKGGPGEPSRGGTGEGGARGQGGTSDRATTASPRGKTASGRGQGKGKGKGKGKARRKKKRR